MTELARVEARVAEEVAAVCRAETEAFIARDFKAWAACWLHDPRTVAVSSSPELGFHVETGWDEIGGNMRRLMNEGKNCRLEAFGIRNLSITVSGDLAWAIYDQIGEHGDREEPLDTFETRCLERVGGRWRIAFASFALRRAFNPRRGRLAVDAARRVTWVDTGTLEALKDHPGLTISRGILRARRPEWDRTLADVVARAGEVTGFFDSQRFAADAGRPFRCPVVLGEDDEGRVAVVLISTRDGAIYVDTDPAGDVAARLRMAEAIFGLSEAQSALAHRIVAGEGLTAAAAALGVSVNTARTHLSRIYDKTGVNAQTALVRLLLSVG